MAPKADFILLVLLGFVFCSCRATKHDQSEFFGLMKASLSGQALSGWDVNGGETYCNFTGVHCNSRGYVDALNISGWSLSGSFPNDVCSYLPELRVVDISRNNIHGNFLNGVVNCSSLEVFNMSSIYIRTKLPDFSKLVSLRVLDLSYNHMITGDFPMSITNLTNLEVLYFNENDRLNPWKLPENISRLSKLRVMVFTTCMLYGRIPASIGNMTSLVDLELSGNYLSGRIPKELGLLKNLQQLELYYNQLSGTIPEELGNLTELGDLDMSVNALRGNIPGSICRLPKLGSLQLYNNSLTGEIPGEIAESTTLSILSLYRNLFSGHLPQNLGFSSPLIVLDLSENNISGPLPAEVCRGGKLLYLLLLDNKFSGNLPESYANCKTLVRFRVSNNYLDGSIPRGLFGLPHVSIIDLADNNFWGGFPNSFGNARNLSELLLQNNKVSGFLPPGISGAVNLGNNLSSSIPTSFSLLKSLNVLDLSNNHLTGNIPECLSELLPNSMNFSNNQLSGPIPLSLIKGGLVESFSGNPGLCVPIHVQNFPICSHIYNQKKQNSMWAIIISVIVITIVALLVLKCRLSKRRAVMEHDETLSSSFFSYDVKSFHRICFDQHEIFEAMVDKNIVGHGGSGMVYRIELQSDFGIAKVLQARGGKDSTTTVIAGTYGYLAPEYAYSNKATTKCDVYSFGVVLMELITGKKPVETDFGENKNIVYWISTKLETKGEIMEVLDKKLSMTFKDEMIQALRIAMRCTCKNPTQRPAMNEVVQLLIEADPCRLDSCKFSSKIKEEPNVNKIKNQSDV
ncbi:hypothetical protein V6N11_017871 [Hibiscus sabdariffa]|uniref:non-specific serine/threonine protein kinase n=1 Tax=Hibiscus sabdariffa TaxID=183260 RepID=A0ABR2T6I2_9ROSI